VISDWVPRPTSPENALGHSWARIHGYCREYGLPAFEGLAAAKFRVEQALDCFLRAKWISWYLAT
jgi:hypothetical protein